METIALQTWDIYYATLVGMAMHPGNEGTIILQNTLEECAKLADQMIQIRNRRTPCQYGQLPSQAAQHS